MKDSKLKALQAENSKKGLENERIWEKLKLLENVADLLKELRGEYEAKEKEYAEKEKINAEKEKEYIEKQKLFEEGKNQLLKKGY